MEDLAEIIHRASAESVSQETPRGVITPLLWTSKSARDPDVARAFDDLINSLEYAAFTDQSWHHFYRFLIASHRTKRLGSRLSVCELVDRLRLSGVEAPGFFAGFYGASMGLLEQYDDQF